MAGIDDMKLRLAIAGGGQNHRNVVGKYKSMKSAILNSYQSEVITYKNDKWQCLINPEKLTEDYDQKVISIDYASGMHPGDVFYWDRTRRWWIVFQAREEEEAYFRASIRKCRYQIETDNDKYWVYLRGPVETALEWNKKHNISFNDMNYSLYLLVTKNEDTNEFFTRHRKLKFDGHNWKVAAVDRYSQDGIIEVYLEEDSDNTMADNMIIPEIIEPKDLGQPFIEGPQSVKPYDTELSYTIKNAFNGTFVVNSTKVKITNSDENTCLLNVVTGKSAEFKLIYRREGEDDIELNVRIESF